MLARLLRLTGPATKIDSGIENYTSRVVPALRKLDGYSGSRLLVNRETGAGMSLTYWNDEQTLRASEAALTDVRGEAASQFGAETPVAENYEIAVQQRLKPSEASNWVRLTTLRGDPAKIGTGVQHFESTVVPALSKLTGFRGAVLFVDRATGGSLVATVWDSRRDLESSAGEVTSIRSGAADAMGATDPQVENFEMAFAELPAPVGG